ncbi:MAG: hypothetical protein SFW36_21735 [Leptolyngbyaceae cyanobacterium bins.59]|nr:hypothetical protein [Leptolyngbyaceae cyanobacterium bins.59]
MASQHQIRQYLAYWFQLGKRVMIRNGNVALLPQPVIEGDRYSKAFEQCWEQIQATNAGDCYLEGTSQTIAQLLTPGWDILPCSRCSMPIPMPNIGLRSLDCPCSDLPQWPNTEIPAPRGPVSTQARLLEIRDRLTNRGQTGEQSTVNASSQSSQAS